MNTNMPNISISCNVETVRFARLKAILSPILRNPTLGNILYAIFRKAYSRSLNSTFELDETGRGAATSALLFGLYESTELKFVKENLSGKWDVIELGGSQGILTRAIDRKLRGKRIFTVEASSRLFKYLEKNASRVQSNNAIYFIRAAVGNNDGTRTFYSGQSSVSGQTIDRKEIQLPNVSREIVSTLTLSALLSENNIGQYSLVSDIEGAEAELLWGDEKSLESCMEIIMECHDTKYQGNEVTKEHIFSRLKSIGFDIVRRRGGVCYAIRSNLTSEIRADARPLETK